MLCLGGGEELSVETEVPFLGRIPLDSRISEKADKGSPFCSDKDDFEDTEASNVFKAIVNKVIRHVEGPFDKTSPLSLSMGNPPESKRDEYQTELLKINYEIG